VSPLPRTRRALVRALVEAPGRREAARIARSVRQLADERAARLLLERFKPLPPDERSRAEACARAATAIAAVDRGKTCRAIAHRLEGILDHMAGRPATARKKLARAAELFIEAGEIVDAGDVHRILVDVLMRAEDYKGARQAADRAKQLYARVGRVDPRRLGSLAMNLGNLHHRRDEYDQALQAYARARRAFARANERLHLAIVDYNRANVLALLDRMAEARRLYERARKVFLRHSVPALVAQAEFALAGIDLIEGRLDLGIERLCATRERFETLGDTYRVAHTDLDAADAFLRLNRPIEAERAGKLAEEFFKRAGQIAETAACAGVLGAAALQKGRAGQAARTFSRGVGLQRDLKNPVAAALLEIGQAQAEIQAGRADRAVQMIRRAARVLERKNLESRQARALAVGAEAALATDRPGLAKRWATRARDLARRRRDMRVEFAAQMVLGKTEERAGRPGSAYRHFRSAERCVDRLRRGITTEESRLAFALDKSEVYEALILNRLDRGDARSVRQALVFAERGKSRALAERLSEGQIEVLSARSPRTRRLLDRLSEVEHRLALAESRLQDPQSAPGLRSGRVADLRSLTRARIETLERLARNDPDRAVLVGATPPDPVEFLGRLGPDDVVLEYTEAGGHYHLFVADRDRVEAIPRLAPSDRVHDLVELLRFQLSKGVLGEAHAERFGAFIESTLRSYFERLHDLLILPVADRLDGKRVRIVPHGLLHGLPFHAFESGGSALVERCSISYAPSLAAMGLLSRGRPRSTSPPLVLGVPDHSAPLIRHEVNAVRRHLGNARVFRGRKATREALRLSEKSPDLLHVACHGFYSEDGPWSSGLRLGDAWLSLPDLYAMKGTARLVVLSGCETGRGTVYSGDEWVGLVRGFLQAGARSVVASLWEVHDRCTVDLMEDFYGGLAGGLPVAEALAVAQRNARRKDGMPLHWAPFVVIGDPDLRITVRKVA